MIGNEKDWKAPNYNLNIIYAIPGLGATKEIFNSTLVTNFSIEVLHWPATQSNLDLRGYAEKFLAQIDRTRTVYLMGVSFGGMICAELADIISPQKTVIISSNKTHKELPVALKIFSSFGIYRIFSDRFIRRFLKVTYRVSGVKKADKEAFFTMIDSMLPNYFKHSASYIFTWRRSKNKTHLHHIHGTADKALPIKYISGSIPIVGGSHAMIYYNSNEINQHLNKIFND